MVVVVIRHPFGPCIPVPRSIVSRRWLLAPAIHPASSGSQSWGWVLGVVPWRWARWLTATVGGARCPVVLSLSVVVPLSTLRAVARSGGIGVPSWCWLMPIAELEPKKTQENIN
jgi:hypothetical protein